MIDPREFAGLPLEDLARALGRLPAREFGASSPSGDGAESNGASGPLALGRVMSGSADSGSLTTILPAYASSSFLPTTHPDVQIPSVDLREYLASGGQGAVYVGIVRETGLAVAVKIVDRAEGSTEASAVREALICARLRHRNIVRVFDAQRCGDYWVLIMELVHGESLADVATTPRRTKQCFAQLADALVHISAHDVVHCDIKPANILCRSGDGSPVILDFGVAVDRSLYGGATRFVGGTPMFLPRDAFLGEVPESSWDAYSLGVTAIYVATGKHAAQILNFPNTDAARMAKLSGEFSDRLRKLVAEISDRTLREWCVEMTADDRDRRMAALNSARLWSQPAAAVG